MRTITDNGDHHNDPGSLDQKLHIEKHPDGNKEEAREHMPERDDVAEGLPGELGFGNDETRQKSTQGQRQSKAVGQKSHGKTDHQDAERKEFAASCPRDLIEHRRNEPFGCHEGESDQADALQESIPQEIPRSLRPHPAR